MAFIIIYITHKNMKEAKKAANHLLKKRLIACANFFPIESAYLWKGKIECTHEIVSIVKAKQENWEKVKAEVARIHPYEVPYIMKINVEANESYEKWINEETQ